MSGEADEGTMPSCELVHCLMLVLTNRSKSHRTHDFVVCGAFETWITVRDDASMVMNARDTLYRQNFLTFSILLC
jgi:hypothetical protein